MIAIIDYGMGNLRSVEKALLSLGCDVVVTQQKSVIQKAQKIVLPGVGAFRDCMNNLRSLGLLDAIRACAWDAIQGGRPFLGICLGLQVLFSESEEEGIHGGMDLIPGRVVRFRHHLKIPHMGWNQLKWRDTALSSRWLRGSRDGDFFYFVHSYYCVPQSEDVIVSTTDYGYEFVSSVARGNLFAVQFHPEKSQHAGLNVLSNFVHLN